MEGECVDISFSHKRIYLISVVPFTIVHMCPPFPTE